jgi:tRNA uracil 4-sulfurtransferase
VNPMTIDQPDVIVLRVAEIFLKGRNRNAFFGALVRNARRLVGDLDGVKVEPGYLRVVVSHPPALRAATLGRLARLFGLASMSPARVVARDLDAFAAAAIAEAQTLPAGTTFKVESRRSDKTFPMTSQELSREVGARVVAATGLPVDVHHPARVLRIDVGAERSFVYGSVVEGPGGLPVGTAGKVSLLLSGGIDSPVAGWYAMRRGCTLGAVYFHSFPYTGDKTKEKVLDLARELAAWQGPLAVDVVHFTEVQKQLRAAGRPELAVLLYRRMMMRAASLLAERDGARALITGDNLGQVASQTLDNLAVVEDAAALPVLRPLITFDKLEIIRQAQRIGTYETSIQPYEDCCSLFVPRHPATRARITDLVRAEEGLDVAALARELAEGAERHVVGG